MQAVKVQIRAQVGEDHEALRVSHETLPEEAASIDEANKERIFHLNAEQLLGL